MQSTPNRITASFIHHLRVLMAISYTCMVGAGDDLYTDVAQSIVANSFASRDPFASLSATIFDYIL